jgi:hypothetical protein
VVLLFSAKTHSISSPALMGPPDVLSSVTIPPIDTVKYSSSLGPRPSSISRIDLLLATPAKK